MCYGEYIPIVLEEGAHMAARKNGKSINLALDEDLIPWVTWAASLYGNSVTAYINDAIKRDSEQLGGLIGREGVAEAYLAWAKLNDKGTAIAKKVAESVGPERAEELGIDVNSAGPCL